jgi:hypothetical protein
MTGVISHVRLYYAILPHGLDEKHVIPDARGAVIRNPSNTQNQDGFWIEPLDRALLVQGGACAGRPE